MKKFQGSAFRTEVLQAPLQTLGLSFLSLTQLLSFYSASDIIVYYIQSIKIQIGLQNTKAFFFFFPFFNLNRNSVLFNGLPAGQGIALGQVETKTRAPE